MLGKTLLLLALPIGGLLAQSSPIHVIISSSNHAEFRIVGTTRDSVERPLFALGVLELALGELRQPGALLAIDVAAVDTLNNVHVEATQSGRVIASGDGRSLTIRRDEGGIAIEARSHVPVLPERKRP